MPCQNAERLNVRDETRRQGKSPSTQAGEFVREEIHHIREGKHGGAVREAGNRDRAEQGTPSRGGVAAAAAARIGQDEAGCAGSV
jgi:hypothetical protein